ncbi:MAG TPA: hypothetical protein VMH27_18050 [Puia sp.]|nr:hypothetical protein [Puia sp.]
MKKTCYFIIALTALSPNLFSQTKVLRPLTAKTVAPPPTANTIEKKEAVAKPQNKPAPTPTDLQNAVINIVVGNDGKDNDTYVSVSIIDGNKRTAAYYGVADKGSYVQGMTTGEYFPGDNETLPTKLDKTEPTGEIDNSKYPPLPVTREANLADFSTGGSIFITIRPNGHDKWNISSFTVTLFFNNDPSSPHRMTWNGFTLAQDSPTKTLEFDKNFNPIQ